MASLSELYYKHMAQREQSAPDLDYYNETKQFLQQTVDSVSPGRQVSDQLASKFLETNLPNQSASPMRVAGNFLGRLYPNLVEGTVKVAGEMVDTVGEVAQFEQSPVSNEILKVAGPLGYAYLKGKQWFTDSPPETGLDQPVGTQARETSETVQDVRDLAMQAVKNAPVMVDPLTPDWARERATGKVASFAESFGEVLVKELPTLAALHGPSNVVGKAAVEGLVKVAPKLFGKTATSLVTTFADDGVTQVATQLAGKEGVRTLTQKLLSGLAYDVAYGVPQSVGLTVSTPAVFAAMNTLGASKDPVERAAARDKIAHRIGEDQFMNLIVGMAASPVLSAIAKGGAKLMGEERAIIETIQTMGADGQTPIPVSTNVGTLMKKLTSVTDPIERQKLVHEIEFTHAEESNTHIKGWLDQGEEVIKDQMGLSRKTGSVLTSWRDQLTQKVQTLNDLIESSGAAPMEAHLQTLEGLMKNIDRLDDVYKSSGLERIDMLLKAPESTLSGDDLLIRNIFEQAELAQMSDPRINIIKEPASIAYLRSLNTGTLLTNVQHGLEGKTDLLANSARSFIDDALAADPTRSKLDILKDLFFDPSVVMDRASVLEGLFDGPGKNLLDGSKGALDPNIADNPELFKDWLDKAFESMRGSQAGDHEVSNLLHKAQSFASDAFIFNGDSHLLTGKMIFGIPDAMDPKKLVAVGNRFWELPSDLIQKSIRAARTAADSFFGSGNPAGEHVRAGFDLLDNLYGRFKVELSNIQPLTQFVAGKQARGTYWSTSQVLTLTDSAHWSTAIHELSHHMEKVLPPEIVASMKDLFRSRLDAMDTKAFGALVGGDGKPQGAPSNWAHDPYWGSFTESFARYFQSIIGGNLAHSPVNVLGMSAENIKLMRASFEAFEDMAGRFYGGKENSIIAREVMGLMIDDLDKAVAHTDRRLKNLSDKFTEAVQQRVPETVKNHAAQVDQMLMDAAPPHMRDSLSQVKLLLSEVDKTLNITQENKTLEQLTSRFFHLRDTFQGHINRTPELRAFYESVVFNGNKKLISDIEAGLKDESLLLKILDSTDDARKLHTEYEAFKNFVMQADEIMSGAYQHSPQVWISHDTKAFTSTAGTIIKDFLRKIPYYRDREGLTVGISRFSRLTDQAEFLIKKMPLLKPVYGAWERFTGDSQRFMNEMLEASHKNMKLDGADTTIDGYFSLTADDPIRKSTNDMLLLSNEVSNELAAGKDALNLPTLDEFGRMDKAALRSNMRNLTDEQFEAAYSHYSGVRKTLSFVLDDMRALSRHKQLMTDSELMALTQKHGQLRGYVPQTRKGKYFLKAMEDTIDDVTGQPTQSPVLIFSDDIAGLRQMQKASYPDGQVGLVNKKMDNGHFSTNAAAIDKIIDTAAAKQGIDDDVLKALKSETANLLKSNSFLKSTIKRRNVAGWDQERITEGIYDYLQNYSRFRHKYDAMSESLTALSYLTDRKYTEGWKWSQSLIQDMNANTDSYKVLQAARSLVIFKTLGFNVSSGFMQLTQNAVMALPRMVLDGIPRSGKLLITAFDDIARKKPLGKYEQLALREGHLTGVTYANNINALTENVRAESTTSKMAQNLLEKSMFMMRHMEELNRQSTLLASYRGIREQILKSIPPGGERNLQRVHDEALQRAVTIVKDSHLTYTKLNRPEVLRGGDFSKQLGRQVYLLKQYSHGYAQLIGYMMRNGSVGQKAAAKSFLAMTAIGGLSALPGYEQLSGSLQSLTGKDANEHLEELMGFGGKVLGNGASAFGPSPLGQRLNPMPRDITSLVTPPGFSLIDGMAEAKKAYSNGDYVRMFWQLPIVPVSLGNVAKSLERASVGRTTRSGKIIPDSQYTASETISGMLGLAPHNEAFLKYTRANFKKQRDSEARSDLFSRIRREGQMGQISESTTREFYETQRKMLSNGQRMSYKSPQDVLRNRYTE